MPETTESLTVLGLMSGTSLDGIDICAARFVHADEKWTFQILHARTQAYRVEQQEWLQNLLQASAEELAYAHMEYGTFLGKAAREFLNEIPNVPIDLIASHGHTLFHRPEHGFTFQLGHGAALAAQTGLPVVSDFRSSDVALGGQGAPLVPIGDDLLFGEHSACLNLGGFANVSFEQDDQRIAFDICPFNRILNHFAQELGQPFDRDGNFARKGKVLPRLLEDWNSLDYYRQTGARSLGVEWVEASVLPLLQIHRPDPEDGLRTWVEHAVEQVDRAIPESARGSVLVTGGGAYHRFFLELLEQRWGIAPTVPEASIIEFKEALIFGFLGALRWLKQPNVYASATGAPADHCAGNIYLA